MYACDVCANSSPSSALVVNELVSEMQYISSNSVQGYMSLHSRMLLPSIPLKESVRGGGGGGGGMLHKRQLFTIVSLMCSLQTFWLGPLT